MRGMRGVNVDEKAPPSAAANAEAPANQPRTTAVVAESPGRPPTSGLSENDNGTDPRWHNAVVPPDFPETDHHGKISRIRAR
nr:hypothetical protein Ade03nite_10210 [Actinoplanes derwentensis]